jgi:hypothetical protein
VPETTRSARGDSWSRSVAFVVLLEIPLAHQHHETLLPEFQAHPATVRTGSGAVAHYNVGFLGNHIHSTIYPDCALKSPLQAKQDEEQHRKKRRTGPGLGRNRSRRKGSTITQDQTPNQMPNQTPNRQTKRQTKRKKTKRNKTNRQTQKDHTQQDRSRKPQVPPVTRKAYPGPRRHRQLHPQQRTG